MDVSGARRRTALDASQARRLTLAAQGFANERRAAPPDAGRLLRSIATMGLLQIDSVNVIVRSHYLPLFSRLGPYDRALLERAVWGPRAQRRLFEYWGHEASMLPLATHPLLRWRMARAARGEGTWGSIARIAREQPAIVARVRDEIGARGPLGGADFPEHRRGPGGWWGWSDVKVALEYLFWSGAVTTATRRGFERLYDLTERVLPPAILALPTPDEAAAQRQLLLLAARSLGVATRADLRDYFRLDAGANARIDELVEADKILTVRVEGWPSPGYLLRDTVVPRRIEAAALLSPFDPVVWQRDRTRRLFGFDYRIEIYTPAHKRVHGYYVLPFLLGDRLVARIDAKAHRTRGALDVIAVHWEDERPPSDVRAALRDEVRRLATWLELDTVTGARIVAS